jgi:tRNA-specific 2-thiouridylase
VTIFAVAMSGGIDSSVVAALLKDQGHEVFGVTMKLWSQDNTEGSRFGISQAKKVANQLGIKHHVVDFQPQFYQTIIKDFCTEYSYGRTPNPCVRCNQVIKFDLLLKKVTEMGATHLATGHYARIAPQRDGYLLLKGIDQNKDQSYFLYRLKQSQLARLKFPLGELTSQEVRQLANNLSLPEKYKSSQDLCFIPHGDYRLFIAQQIRLKAGDIVDRNGRLIEQHHGLCLYTIGQRQGLGISDKKRLYVLAMQIPVNRIIVGEEAGLFSHWLVASDLNWITNVSYLNSANLTAKVRYRAPAIKASVTQELSCIRLEFEKSQRAITPGQSVVLYSGDVVIGGGIIENCEAIEALK